MESGTNSAMGADDGLLTGQTRSLDRLRMRTTLLIPFLVMSFGWTVISLLIIRTIVTQEIGDNLASDLQHSLNTYQNLQQQRRNMIARESALLADLPTLKALMTANDARTIQDGGGEFWRVSGSDFFALLDRNGKLIAEYNRGASLDNATVQSAMTASLAKTQVPQSALLDGHLFEISIQPLLFGPQSSGIILGYVAVGYAIDEHVAQEVSEASAAQVAFAANGKVVASTLPKNLQEALITKSGVLMRSPSKNVSIQLGSEQYLGASIRLSSTEFPEGTDDAPQLIVLKSFDQASRLVRRVNQWVIGLGLLALLVGMGLVVSISRTVTTPLKLLVGGTRALAQGNFEYQLSEGGAEEVRELSRSFEHMRVELRRTQRELLDAERLATIGRMASSISHDLRHHLSAMYANAEFMSDSKIDNAERQELLREVNAAVHSMTDLLDSLLLFTQTGRALRPEFIPLALVIQRAVGMVRSHPDTRNVNIALTGLSSIEAWVDPKKLGRAVYNLLLNGCQAAKRGKPPATVALLLYSDERFIRISISDSGPGIPESIRQTMFLPFVSEGKESGIGLGLTLTHQIAQEHGGYINLDSVDGQTTFSIILLRSALDELGAVAIRRGVQAPTR
jgi:signal transduction histidine kinase